MGICRSFIFTKQEDEHCYYCDSILGEYYGQSGYKFCSSMCIKNYNRKNLEKVDISDYRSKHLVGREDTNSIS